MKMRVVILPDGQISLFSDEGTFAEGKEKIEAVLAALSAQGFEVTDSTPVEQHRHEHEGVHTHQHDHSHPHSH